jgi:hypothetical protein
MGASSQFISSLWFWVAGLGLIIVMALAGGPDGAGGLALSAAGRRQETTNDGNTESYRRKYDG